MNWHPLHPLGCVLGCEEHGVRTLPAIDWWAKNVVMSEISRRSEAFFLYLAAWHQFGTFCAAFGALRLSVQFVTHCVALHCVKCVTNLEVSIVVCLSCKIMQLNNQIEVFDAFS